MFHLCPLVPSSLHCTVSKLLSFPPSYEIPLTLNSSPRWICPSPARSASAPPAFSHITKDLHLLAICLTSCVAIWPHILKNAFVLTVTANHIITPLFLLLCILLIPSMLRYVVSFYSSYFNLHGPRKTDVSQPCVSHSQSLGLAVYLQPSLFP